MGNSVFTRVLLKEYCGNLALFSPSVFSSLLLYFLMMVGDFDPYTWWRIEEDLLIRDGEQIWIRVLRQILCSLHHGVGEKFPLAHCRMLCLVFMQIEWFVFIAWYDELTPQMSLATSQDRQFSQLILSQYTHLRYKGCYCHQDKKHFYNRLDILIHFQMNPSQLVMFDCWSSKLETMKLCNFELGFQTFKVCNTDNIMVACKLWHSNL